MQFLPIILKLGAPLSPPLSQYRPTIYKQGGVQILSIHPLSEAHLCLVVTLSRVYVSTNKEQ